MRALKITIEEKLTKTIVVNVPDDCDTALVEEAVHEACEEGVVDLTYEDFSERSVEYREDCPEGTSGFYDNYGIDMDDCLVFEREGGPF